MGQVTFRQRNFQQADGTTRSAQTRSNHGGQEQHIPLADGVIGAIVLHLTVAGEAHQHARGSFGTDSKRRFCAEPPQPEMFTIKEPLSQHRLYLIHHWRHRTDGTLRKINTGHRLIDLQGSRLAGLGINMVPVVKAKRHVAVFLHFKDHHVAQRVNGPGWYENSVAGLRSEGGEMVRHRSVRERLPQSVCRGGRLEARVDAAFCPRLQHHPGFGFPGLAWREIYCVC